MSIHDSFFQFAGFLLQTIPVAALYYSAVSEEYLNRPRYLCLRKFLWQLPLLGLGFVGLANYCYLLKDLRFQLWEDIYMSISLMLCVWRSSRDIEMNWKKKLICLMLVVQFEAIIVNGNTAILNFMDMGGNQDYAAYYPENVGTLLLMTVALFPLVYLLLARVVRDNLQYIQGKTLERGCLYVILCLIVYFLVTFIRFDFIVSWIWAQLAVLFCNVLIYFIYFMEISMVRQQDQLKIQMETMEAKYRLIQENIELTRRTRHDMRHQFNALRAMFEENNLKALGELLEADEKQLNVLEESSHICSYPMLDSLLRYYVDYARNCEITTQYDVQVTRDYAFSMVDMTALLGNCMENAIEACKKLPSKQRFIRIEVREKSEMLLFRIENSCEDTKQHTVREYSGWKSFLSEKRTEGHGIGLQSMQQIAQAYGGMALMKQEGGRFVTRISLKIPQNAGGVSFREQDE